MNTDQQNGYEWRCKKLEANLRNLLARIHRDGGHYVEQHGLDKASADAETIVGKLLEELEEWQLCSSNSSMTEINILRGQIALTRGAALHIAGASNYNALRAACERVVNECNTRAADIDPDVLLQCQEALASPAPRVYTAEEIRPLMEALRKHHQHAKEGAVVFFEQDGKPSEIATDLGDAYQDSGLCEETCDALYRARTLGLLDERKEKV